MRTVLILNPTSGSSVMAPHQGTAEGNQETILAALHTYGIEPEIQYTTPEDPGSGLAKQAAESGVDMVIAAGGDGTLHAIASGLIGTQSILGIIPLGTMNNVAHSLEIPEDIAEACAIIASGTTGLVDVGKINDTFFLEVAGVGLEAALFPAAEEIKSGGLLSTLRGIGNGLTALQNFASTRFTTSLSGRRLRHFRAIQISVCNSPYYGAHLQFAPDAIMDDGFLDVLIYKNFSKLNYIHYAISISRGQRTVQAKVVHRKVKSLQIHADPPVQIHADGVPIGQTPAVITVQPGALRVRVPRKVAASSRMSRAQRKRNQSAQADTILEEKGPSHAR